MKNWSYILLISLCCVACNRSNKESTIAETSPPKELLPEVVGTTDPDSSFLQSQKAQAKADSSAGAKHLTQKYIPPPREPGGKGVNVAQEAYWDSILSLTSWAERNRINDSLLIIARRKSAIKDSLRKLK